MSASTIESAFRLKLIMLIFCMYCSCGTETRRGEKSDKYSIHLIGGENDEYIVSAASLDSGVIVPEARTKALPDSLSRNMIIKDGYYYSLQRKTGILSKYALKNGVLSAVAHLTLPGYHEENYIWTGKDSLLLSGLNSGNSSALYYLINTREMSILDKGPLPLLKPEGKLKSMSIGFVKRRGARLFVGYCFHAPLSPATFTTSDSMYISTLSFPEMRSLKIETDGRSTYPGGVNTVQHNEFTDESGDFYFMTCPGIAMGNRPDLPTAIFRISHDSEKVDPGYCLDISSQIGNHAYGLWYIGKGMAIVRAERKDLYKGLADHYSTPHFEFYLVDIKNEKVLRKLDLPLDRGTRKECVLLENGLVYIAVNSNKGDCYIWKYDPERNTLKRGLRISGAAEYIVRIDRLNH